MRRSALVSAGVSALLLAAAVPASAESTTVPGTGDISSLFVDNAQRAVNAKVYGLPGPCETRDVSVFLSWRGDPGRYRAIAACYAGTDWHASLEYLPDGDVQSAEPVECADFTMKYNRAGDFFTVHVPRGCLTEAPRKIRGYSEAVEYGSATGGTAGPTKLLDRG